MVSSKAALPIVPGRNRQTIRRHPPAQRAVVNKRPARRAGFCRADVHWDAFRAEYDLGTSTRKPANAAPSVRQYDFLVIGSGIAGLSYALKVAEYGRVAVVTKDFADEGCTQYAQGGVCAVLDTTDSVADHVRDTMVAGAFLNDQQAVEVVCREGPARVLELVHMGAEFTRNQDGTLHLTREGGHSARRIVHAADVTGREIERALLHNARSHRNIDFYEHHLAVDLVVEEVSGMPHCLGADVLDQRSSSMCRFIGLTTMLASGGGGQVYPNTTNPHVSTGDGMAMAYRAGARVSNMEFVQFHPTALYTPNPQGRTFLISEAVRGEGGILYNLGGDRFMSQYDPTRMELAPRDIVARAIHDQLAVHGDAHVWLDISHKPRGELLSHFPNIAARCRELGIDITQEPIPVTPAQHYMCGGVQTGLLGETNIQGLYACGEVACSGLHGANRLASNSLLEGLVFADRAVQPSVAHAEHAMRSAGRTLHYVAATASFVGARAARQASQPAAAWIEAKRRELRELMWRNVGIVRRMSGLFATLEEVNALQTEIRAVTENFGVNTQMVELGNLAAVAEMIVMCALQRKESRGGHFVHEFPQEEPAECQASVVSRSMREALLVGGGAGMGVAQGVQYASRVGGADGGGRLGAADMGVKRARRDLAVRSTPEKE